MTSIFLQLRKSQNVLNFCSHLFENQLRYTVAHIGHQYIFFSSQICNSNFYHKYPSCKNCAIFNSDFCSENPGCKLHEFYNSDFCDKNPSCRFDLKFILMSYMAIVPFWQGHHP